MLQTSHWQYQGPIPTTTGSLKQQMSDFKVIEQLGYTLSGEGEHCFLWLRKTGLNTAFVAEQLAKFAQVPLRAVTYAGRKDKYAVTEQWFGVHIPGKREPDWSSFSLEGTEILDHTRHHKKLRVGALQGNRFEIIIRDLKAGNELTERLRHIARYGVPNYFGSQRFGNNESNLRLAEKMLSGEQIRNRNKRSMCISALRSWLFNEFVSQRLAQQLATQIMLGDAMQLVGSNSFFIQNQSELDTSQSRLKQFDIALTAPMWGQGELPTKDDAQRFEQTIANQFPAICQLLAELGLKQERRSIHLFPQNMSWQIDGEQLILGFELPSGCFATSVIREILQINTATESDHEIAAE